MSEQESPVLVTREGSVAIITLNRPEAGNALDVAMSEALLHAAIECDCNDEVRAVILNARGKMFCAGGDLNSFSEAGLRSPNLISEETAYLHAAVLRLAKMNKPLVVAVQGFAAGAGFSLSILGDIVIASDRAQFTLAYTAIGMTPDGGASWLLPRLVGLRRAQEMILTNTRLSGAEALAEGLITKVVPSEELAEESLLIAKTLANGPTRAFSRCRDLLLSCFNTSIEAHLDQETRHIVRSVGERDGKAGIAAFLRKEKPTFRGE